MFCKCRDKLADLNIRLEHFRSRKGDRCPGEHPAKNEPQIIRHDLRPRLNVERRTVFVALPSVEFGKRCRSPADEAETDQLGRVRWGTMCYEVMGEAAITSR